MSNAGRPTEYKKEYVEEVDAYILDCEDEIENYIKSQGDKSTSYERIVNVKLPSVEGLALRLGVSKKSLYNWEKEHKEFLHALDKIKLEQKKRLMEMGLSGQYNSTIAKLILSANHGMKEKTETDLTTKGDKIQGFNFIKNDTDNSTDN